MIPRQNIFGNLYSSYNFLPKVIKSVRLFSFKNFHILRYWRANNSSIRSTRLFGIQICVYKSQSKIRIMSNIPKNYILFPHLHMFPTVLEYYYCAISCVRFVMVLAIATIGRCSCGFANSAINDLYYIYYHDELTSGNTAKFVIGS